MTSLPFTNTLSAFTEAATHTHTHTGPGHQHREGWGFEIKRDRERAEKEKYTHWLLGKFGVVFRIWLWSGPTWPTLTTENPRVNRSSPILTKRKRGMKRKEWQAVITKTTTVRFRDGSPGENRWVIRSGWSRCSVALIENLCYTCVTVQPSVTDMWSSYYFYILKIWSFLPSWNSRSKVRVTRSRFLNLLKDTYMNGYMAKLILVC